MSRAYLDHASTVPLRPCAREAMVAALTDLTGDPGRIHEEGMASRVALEQAREQVAQLLGARSREVVFTSGATESIAAAVFGAAERAAARGTVDDEGEDEADALEAIKSYRASTGRPALPANGSDDPLVMDLAGTGRPLSDRAIYAIVKEVCRRAADSVAADSPDLARQIDAGSTHWLRHTAASHQIDRGVDPFIVQRNLRHASFSTTEGYIHKDRDQQHQETEKHTISRRDHALAHRQNTREALEVSPITRRSLRGAFVFDHISQHDPARSADDVQDIGTGVDLVRDDEPNLDE